MLDVTRRELMPLVGGAGLVCAARVEQHLNVCRRWSWIWFADR
jgi:hypothetical protein